MIPAISGTHTVEFASTVTANSAPLPSVVEVAIIFAVPSLTVA